MAKLMGGPFVVLGSTGQRRARVTADGRENLAETTAKGKNRIEGPINRRVFRPGRRYGSAGQGMV
jgi:hypothetical protein